MVPAFCRSAVIHAMPERLAKKRFRIDLISTEELAPAFATGVKVIELSEKHFSDRAFLVVMINISMHVWERQSVKRSRVCLRLISLSWRFSGKWSGLSNITWHRINQWNDTNICRHYINNYSTLYNIWYHCLNWHFNRKSYFKNLHTK